eukprot:scaffold42128_cov26-Tisochrysis_lutea.AAC.2
MLPVATCRFLLASNATGAKDGAALAPGSDGKPSPGNGGKSPPGSGGKSPPGSGGKPPPGSGGKPATCSGGKPPPGSGGKPPSGNDSEPPPGSGGRPPPGSGGKPPGNGDKSAPDNGSKPPPGSGANSCSRERSTALGSKAKLFGDEACSGTVYAGTAVGSTEGAKLVGSVALSAGGAIGMLCAGAAAPPPLELCACPWLANCTRCGTLSWLTAACMRS